MYPKPLSLFLAAVLVALASAAPAMPAPTPSRTTVGLTQLLSSCLSEWSQSVPRPYVIQSASVSEAIRSLHFPSPVTIDETPQASKVGSRTHPVLPLESSSRSRPCDIDTDKSLEHDDATFMKPYLPSSPPESTDSMSRYGTRAVTTREQHQGIFDLPHTDEVCINDVGEESENPRDCLKAHNGPASEGGEGPKNPLRKVFRG